jgi:hypothetical protein
VQLQYLEVPKGPWDVIVMDFSIGLPRTRRDKDAVWVVGDWLSKVPHFYSFRTIDSASDLVPILVCDIARLHGVPITTTSDSDAKFVLKFRENLQCALGT